MVVHKESEVVDGKNLPVSFINLSAHVVRRQVFFADRQVCAGNILAENVDGQVSFIHLDVRPVREQVYDENLSAGERNGPVCFANGQVSFGNGQVCFANGQVFSTDKQVLFTDDREALYSEFAPQTSERGCVVLDQPQQAPINSASWNVWDMLRLVCDTAAPRTSAQ